MSPVPAAGPTTIATRPHPAFVLFHRPWAWLLPGLLPLAVADAVRGFGLDPLWLRPIGGTWLLLGLVWRFIAWRRRLYRIADSHMHVLKGVVWRAAATVPLARVQHVTVTRSPLERLLGLGTIQVATADGPALAWVMVSKADSIQQAIADALAAGSSPPTHDRVERDKPDPPVIGIAGGIGSGKSEFARALAALGCLVVDSDAEAKAALELPEVRAQLRVWWGDRPFGPDGSVDRKALASIVFADPAERRRLEGLIHPLVKRKRDAMKAQARATGAAAVVVDAPLLFEAGVDAECDAVVFIDAPREARLQRVRTTRGWDEAEFDRRERAQMSLDEKRRQSTIVVENAADPEALRQAAAHVLQRMRESRDSATSARA